MNTIRSTWCVLPGLLAGCHPSLRYGWATLCVAGGGAYYFAKKQINADRAERYNKERLKQERLHRLEVIGSGYNDKPVAQSKRSSQIGSTSGMHNSKGLDHAGSPSNEASEDVAPVGHAPETIEQRTRERSKYEAAEPYRSKKGDRFS